MRKIPSVSLIPDKVKCLYYPYSRCRDLTTLKVASLIFDEICFADTEPWFVRQALLSSDPKNNENNEACYDFLTKKGILQLIDPTPILKSHDFLLTANAVNDVEDDIAAMIAIKESVQVWDVARRRLPPSFIEAFYPGAGTFSEAVTLQALVHYGGKMEAMPTRLRSFAEFRWNGISENEAWDYLRSHYRLVIGGNPHMRLETYEVPFLQASALRVSEALVLSSIENCVPFTDSDIHHKMLVQKTKRALNLLSSDPQIAKMIGGNITTTLTESELTLVVLNNLIPKEELEKRTIEEIVSYREGNLQALRQLREKLAEIATALEDIEPTDEYRRKLEKSVRGKIIPELAKVRNDLQISWEDAFGKFAIESTGAIVPTMCATIAAGLDFWQVLGACAVAGAGVGTTKMADAMLKTWRAGKNARQHSFSYFTNF